MHFTVGAFAGVLQVYAVGLLLSTGKVKNGVVIDICPRARLLEHGSPRARLEFKLDSMMDCQGKHMEIACQESPTYVSVLRQALIRRL